MYSSVSISVPKAIIDIATKHLKNHNLGNRGIEDGNFEQQLTGLIGELVVYKYLFGELPDFNTKENTFDGGFDIEYNNKKIDVKTMGRNSFVKGDYVNNFYVMQQKYNCDILVFCSFHKSQNILEICGWIEKKDLNTKGIFYKAGTTRIRENGTSFKFRQDNFEIMNKDLNKITNL